MTEPTTPTGPVDPGQGTTPTSSPASNPATKYPAIQDFLAFSYIEATTGTINEQLGGLGDQLKIVQDLILILNPVQVLATTRYQMTLDAQPIRNLDGTQISVAQLNDINKLLANAYNEILRILNSDQLDPSIFQHVQNVATDIERSGLNIVPPVLPPSVIPLDSFRAWYSNQGNQDDIRTAVESSMGFSDQQQNNIREALFLYEQFVKGAAAMLAQLDQALGSLSTSMRS